MAAEDMIPTTRDRPGSYDAIATAKPDEPLFPIQGGDPLGPPTVLHWAGLCREAGLAASDPRKSERLLRKACDAEQVAWAMMEYQRNEAPLDGQRATYNDSGPIIAEANNERKVREALIKASGGLHNLLAGAKEIADIMAALRVHPEEEVKIREAIDLLRSAAFGIEPRRGNERS